MTTCAARRSKRLNYRLAFVRVFVTDWSRAVRFYEETLEMTPTLVTNGWAQFATGQAQLALEQVDPADPESADSVGRFLAVSLEVDDIDATYATLQGRGVEFLGAPEKQPWGGTLAHLRDPDGNVLTLLGR
jgi:predicted enzyme related to lactoylglutathione lyase